MDGRVVFRAAGNVQHAQGWRYLVAQRPTMRMSDRITSETAERSNVASLCGWRDKGELRVPPKALTGLR